MKKLVLFLAASVALAANEPLPPERVATMIEALTRLGPEKVHGNDRLRAALVQLLAATRGTPQFAQLVNDFGVEGQEAGLIEVAAKFPGDEAGVTAARLVLISTNRPPLAAALTSAQTAALARALGNTADKRAVPWLLPLLADVRREPAARKAAVRALAQTQEGAAELLRLAREEKLGADVRFVAGAELNAARWPAIRAEAVKLLPPPAGRNDQPLPPLAELLKLQGASRRGEEVFAREEVGCAKCHVVNGRGIDFGPALSEIGTKLGREALLEAILDPSAGISFGYEAWTFEMKSGDELFGLIVSDAADEVALKVQGGAVNRLKKSEIARRTQAKLSIMPTGLAQAMTVQELADLVEYLTTLRKK